MATVDEPTTENRRQRRAKAKQQRSGRLDRAGLLRFAAALVEADSSVSGITLITTRGEVSYIDGATLRRGGRA